MSDDIRNGSSSAEALTDREYIEQLRREFTANVSHELKTPLHSISGYAELLKNGMVRPDDIAQFAGRIYAEAQRMIYLVDDIIKLSHLDEGASDMTRERVDLYTLAENTADILTPEASAKGIAIFVKGEHAEITGVTHLISGIIYNLCDNAIKYNLKDGSVTIEVKNEDDRAVLSVSDTGIGIPEDQHDRIFERFYRVDKMRSKEVGGTGLGLSIVKHSAMLHNAEIKLESRVNCGTVVTMIFPKM